MVALFAISEAMPAVKLNHKCGGLKEDTG